MRRDIIYTQKLVNNRSSSNYLHHYQLHTYVCIRFISCQFATPDMLLDPSVSFHSGREVLNQATDLLILLRSSFITVALPPGCPSRVRATASLHTCTTLTPASSSGKTVSFSLSHTHQSTRKHSKALGHHMDTTWESAEAV